MQQREQREMKATGRNTEVAREAYEGLAIYQLTKIQISKDGKQH